MFGNSWVHVTTWAILHLPVNIKPVPLSISLQQRSRCIGSEICTKLISQSPKQLLYCCQTMYDQHDYIRMQSYIGCCSCIVCCNCNDCCSCTVSWSCWPPVCSISWEYTYSSILCFARATCGRRKMLTELWYDLLKHCNILCLHRPNLFSSLST